MKKICFVCLGNICRSPMAEFVMKDYVRKQGREKDFEIQSRALSYEELGNDIHPGTKRLLEQNHIPYEKRRSTVLNKEDYSYYDYFICMDNANLRRMNQLFQTTEKQYQIMDFTSTKKEVRDPYFTGDFEETYQDIQKGIQGFYEFLEKRN